MNMDSYSCCSSPLSLEFGQVVSLSNLLKLVSERSRLKLLCILRQGEHCVCELEKHLNMSQSLISHHLSDLKSANIVSDEKRGLKVYYSLSKKGKSVINLLFSINDVEVADK